MYAFCNWGQSNSIRNKNLFAIIDTDYGHWPLKRCVILNEINKRMNSACSFIIQSQIDIHTNISYWVKLQGIKLGIISNNLSIMVYNNCILQKKNKKKTSYHKSAKTFLHYASWIKLAKFKPHSLLLIHWGRMTHVCISKLTIFGSDNGLSPGRRQAIIWINAGILLIGPSGTISSEILIEIHIF